MKNVYIKAHCSKKKVLVESFMTENEDRELVIKGAYILFLFLPFPKEEGEDGAEGISGAKILNHLMVVLQQLSSFENTGGSSCIYSQKRITQS